MDAINDLTRQEQSSGSPFQAYSANEARRHTQTERSQADGNKPSTAPAQGSPVTLDPLCDSAETQARQLLQLIQQRDRGGRQASTAVDRRAGWPGT